MWSNLEPRGMDSSDNIPIPSMDGVLSPDLLRSTLDVSLLEDVLVLLEESNILLTSYSVHGSICTDQQHPTVSCVDFSSFRQTRLMCRSKGVHDAFQSKVTTKNQNVNNQNPINNKEKKGE